MEDQKLQDQIVELAAAIAKNAQANDTNDVVITITRVNGKIAVACGGTTENMVRVVASAINKAPELEKVFTVAVEAAPMLGLMDMFAEVADEGKKKDADDCDCPACQLRRQLEKRRR